MDLFFTRIETNMERMNTNEVGCIKDSGREKHFSGYLAKPDRVKVDLKSRFFAPICTPFGINS